MPKKNEIHVEEPVVEKEIIKELGSIDGDSKFVVIRDFFLRVRPGPLQRIEAGRIVQLTGWTAVDAFFSGMTEPLEVAEEFTVLLPFQVTGEDGCWISPVPGDIVKLSRQEAIDLLRRRVVKERG